ncbi:MAG: hypothetical protein M3474_01535 [Actinomycetota bacterium]|nr:hypothetical protein [Actinomycetota bacterium]
MPARGSLDELVAHRGPAMWQLAWLLTGTETAADLLLEECLVRVLLRRRQCEDGGHDAEAVVRHQLVATYLAGHHDEPGPTPLTAPDPAANEPDVLGRDSDAVEDLRRQVLVMLAALPARHRCALVLQHSLDVAEWQAADALEMSTAQLVEAVADAAEMAGRVTMRAPTLLGCLHQVVPQPVGESARMRRVHDRVSRSRNRRSLVYVSLSAALIALVVVPIALSDPAPSPGQEASEPATLPFAQRLVDPLRIPDSCADVADVPEPPGYRYELFGADAVWLRFCPADDAGGALAALAFAPDDTVVDREVDRLVDGWALGGPGPAACHPTAGIRDGLVRAQVGTLDGSLHIVDMRVGCARSVTVDGRAGAVDSRTALTEAVSLLGSERLAEVAEPGVVPPQALFCPTDPARLLGLERTTISDYPKVRGLSMPLPATSALVCHYPADSAAGARADSPRGRLLDAPAAESLRAAYLSRSSQPPDRDCQSADGDRFGAVLSDATGSRRTFMARLGGCGSVRGPLGAEGPAGAWLAELLSRSTADE